LISAAGRHRIAKRPQQHQRAQHPVAGQQGAGGLGPIAVAPQFEPALLERDPQRVLDPALPGSGRRPGRPALDPHDLALRPASAARRSRENGHGDLEQRPDRVFPVQGPRQRLAGIGQVVGPADRGFGGGAGGLRAASASRSAACSLSWRFIRNSSTKTRTLERNTSGTTGEEM